MLIKLPSEHRLRAQDAGTKPDDLSRLLRPSLHE